jgi:hypothetical protein
LVCNGCTFELLKAIGFAPLLTIPAVLHLPRVCTLACGLIGVISLAVFWAYLFETQQGEKRGPERSLKERATLSFCCKVAVIFLALYAIGGVKFCSNDCFPAENDWYSLEGTACRY